MYKTEVDARGQACPKPVIMTKEALEKIEEGIVKTLVDNETAKENVVKMAHKMSLPVAVSEEGGQYEISINKVRPITTFSDIVPGLTPKENWHLVVTSNILGHGEEALGKLLIKSFFYALSNSANLPAKIAFLNSGIYLVCQDSAVLESLETIKNKNVEIVVCGTCLDFYQMKDNLKVGQVSNMYDILEIMALGKNTIVL